MEFAKPLLALTRWKLRVFPVFPSANLSSIEHPSQPSPSRIEDLVADGFQSAHLNVFTMRKSRTRSNTKRSQAARNTAPASPQPLQTGSGAPSTAPHILKIVQREPRKQPECLLISGRMADVCAALERMARNERAMQA
ncbi:MAG: hypothetical protein LBJ15_14620 [Comamonas sp.]|jgi:hypothetical protein|uniref:hypothetical protein n=1 Tax=Comamonas sp. TaxID=34028 RepID=UPI002817F9EE|nr:hypothetical protein [Comamonas sp.]MDR0215225.1 hypothetical protein [Comamonas sp.]